MVKHLTTMQETWAQSLGREALLEKEMATHSSILVWRIPWMEEPGRLQSMGVAKSRTRLSDFTHSLGQHPGFSSRDTPNNLLSSSAELNVNVKLLSSCLTLRPHGHQAPLSMGFSRQEYWSGLPFPSPGNLPDPGIEPRSPAL